MNEQEFQFRGVLFGGFHRQDVLDCMESMAQEAQEERTTLIQALDEARASLKQAEERLAQQEIQFQEKSDRCRDLEEQNNQLKMVLDEKTEELLQTEVRASDLETKIKLLEPQAESWRHLRDVAGEIEVAAHERAQMTLQQAQAESAEVRAESARWVMEIQTRCNLLQRDIQSSMLAAETELNTIRDSFSQAEDEMEGFQHALSSLIYEVDECPEEHHQKALTK